MNLPIFKKIAVVFLVLFSIQVFVACGKPNSQKLVAEKVDTPKKENPKENTEENPKESGNLFGNEPGTIVKMANLNQIDPIGTSITDDFDGDGIRNKDEITTNAWVANYPRIEVYIAPPVTLKIEVQDETETQTKVIQSEITSSDVEFKREHSTDAIHNNEVNLRTVQYQDSMNSSSSNSHEEEHSKSSNKSKTYSGEVSIFHVGGGKASYSHSEGSSKSSKVANAHSEAYGETKTEWKDVPFKNNTDRNGWSMKSNSAAKNARNLRKDIRTSFTGISKVKANAGYVRASLYIKNETVNTPVKLSNILCSLMFETPKGQLIPVQSFRLRNDDYSMFEIEVYGAETFGPYVVELKNLNTHEVKEAIEKGYNPKIFIVDYDMTHVDDSNYKLKLSDKFTGDNLKIIEENAKGRTAGVRIIGPNMRNFYRITAFEAMLGDNVAEENQLGVVEADAMKPGVSLKKALKRLSYSGVNIEFANYIADFSGMVPEMKIEGYKKPMFMFTAIKSIDGIKTKIPLVEFNDEDGNIVKGALKDSNGNNIEYNGMEIYLTKPASQWTEEEARSFKAWVVMNDSKFFGYTNDVYNENGETVDLEFIDQNGEQQKVPVVEGINSIIWPGDHYDVVYLNMEEYYKMLESFGHTPFDTHDKLKFNTKWKKSDLGEHPFYPDTNSTYLGKVALGDTIQFKIKLNWTRYLNPSFGEVKEVNNFAYYNDFSYDMLRTKSENKFLLEDAVDFEINFASGGEYEHWLNLKPKRMPYSIFNDYYVTEDENYENIEYLWDFMNQVFVVKLKIPSASEIEGRGLLGGMFPGISDDGLISVFLRTGLNTAYRESIWPLTDVKKFRGFLYRIKADNNTETDVISYDKRNIKIKNSVGNIEVGNTIKFYDNSINEVYNVSAVTDNEDKSKTVTLSRDISDDIKGGEYIYVDYGANKEKLKPEISVNKVKNSQNLSWWDDNINFLQSFSNISSWGFNYEHIVNNWTGDSNLNNPNWNTWSDASDYDDFLTRIFRPFLTMNNSLGNYSLEVDLSLKHDEFDIAQANNGEHNYQISEVYNDKVLIIWQQSDSSILGKIINIKTGAIVRGRFTITDNTQVSDIKISNVANNKILITWINGNNQVKDLRGIIINMDNGHLIPSIPMDYTGFLIKREEFSGLNDISVIKNYRVSVYENKALVVWNTSNSNNNFTLGGKFIDLNNAQILESLTLDISPYYSNPYNPNNHIYSYNIDYDITLTENNIFVFFANGEIGLDSQYAQPCIRKFNMSGENEDLKVFSLLTRTISDLKILKFNNLFYLLWNLDNNTYIQKFNFSSFQNIGNSISYLNEYYNYSIKFNNDKAFVISHIQNEENYSENYIVGQQIDVTTGKKIGNQIYIAKTNDMYSSYGNNTPLVALGNNTALAVWSEENGEYPNITTNFKGRVIDLHSTLEHIEDGLNYFFKAPLIEREYEVQVKILK